MKIIAHIQTDFKDKFGIPREEFVNTYNRFHQAVNPQLLAKPMADIEKVLSHICKTGRKNRYN